MLWFSQKKDQKDLWIGLANEFSLAAKLSLAAGARNQTFIKDISKQFSSTLKLAEGGHVRAGILYNYAYALSGKFNNPDGTLDCLLEPERRRKPMNDEIEEIQRINHGILTAFNEYDLERCWRPHDMEQLEKRKKISKSYEIWKATEQAFSPKNQKRDNQNIFSATFEGLLLQMAYET